MKNKSIYRLIKLIKPYRLLVLITAVLVFLANAAEIVKPIILKVVIDDFLIGNRPESGLYSINAMAVFYMLVIFINSAFTYAQANIMNYVGQGIVNDLRKRLFSHIQHLPLSYLNKYSTGRLITRATNDAEAVNEMFTDVFVSLFKDLVLIIGIIIVMFRLDTNLALIGLATVPLIAIVTYYFRKIIRKNFQLVKSLIGRINGFLAENLSGMKLVQVFNRELEKQREFEELNDKYNKATIFQIKLNSVLRPIIQILQNITIALLIWYSMDKVLDYSLELGVVFAFTNYIKQFFAPINDLAESYNTIQSAIVSADRIFELLDEEDALEDLETGRPVDGFKGSIEFRNVWFAYNDEDWILKDISFKINPGETAAFVGATGAGKTTIINLITRFYEIQKGEILIDDININEYKLHDLRKHVAVVLQDVFLFSGDIKSNIRLNSDISDEEIEKVIDLSYSRDLIDELPKGIDEPVRERGSTFSTGQRQLLSFARAIAHNPFILVLDEATANIDTRTELLIQKSIDSISKDRTTLIIAHRLSTIRQADTIIFLDKGRIMEVGNHDDLLENGKYYRELYEAQ